MAQNVCYIPAVSQAISSSWMRNVQSPSLRRKLEQLVEPSQSILAELGNYNVRDLVAETPKPSIEARLWSILRLVLYDPAACRRLKVSPSRNEAEANEDVFEDILDHSNRMNKISENLNENWEDWSEDEESCYESEELLFDDLWTQNEAQDNPWDEKFGSFEGIENLSIQQETDNMLLEADCTIDDVRSCDFSLAEREIMLI